MDILISPKECQKLVRVTLPNPRDGTEQHFLRDEENLTLYEIIKFSEQYRSWLIDDLLCREGHFNMLTKVDPLYLFIRVLSARASEQFRPLYDICHEFATEQREFSPLETALSPDIHWPYICDTQDIDGELFVKFSLAKTMDWLLRKHEKLMETLKLDLGDSASKATLMTHASDLLSDYIPGFLNDKLKKAVKDKHTIGRR